MQVEGTVRDGMVVLNGDLKVPDGTKVKVTVADEQETAPTLLDLLKLAGAAKDLPADFAEQHDHYLHGTAKR
ncbi:MAG: hypothetical protein U0793_07905 [Gemmataceae bacterium]